MRVFGLTGGIGSGKSTVADLFREAGIPVVDADRVAREVTAPGTEPHREIVRAFGPGILREGGEIDRKRLGGIVFADPARRAVLEAITHPRIREGIVAALREIEAAGHPVAVVEAALIHEKGRQGLFEAVIAVRCAPDVQVRRLMARDGLTEEHARRILEAQMDPEAKARASEYVIDNSGDPAATRAQVEALAARLLQKASTRDSEGT